MESNFGESCLREAQKVTVYAYKAEYAATERSRLCSLINIKRPSWQLWKLGYPTMTTNPGRYSRILDHLGRS